MKAELRRSINYSSRTPIYLVFVDDTIIGEIEIQQLEKIERLHENEDHIEILKRIFRDEE